MRRAQVQRLGVRHSWQPAMCTYLWSDLMKPHKTSQACGEQNREVEGSVRIAQGRGENGPRSFVYGVDEVVWAWRYVFTTCTTVIGPRISEWFVYHMMRVISSSNTAVACDGRLLSSLGDTVRVKIFLSCR